MTSVISSRDRAERIVPISVRNGDTRRSDQPPSIVSGYRPESTFRIRAIGDATLLPELAPGQHAERLEVLLARLLDDGVGKHGAGRLLVELDLLEVVPDELLVVRGRRDAGAVPVLRPVAGGVGREDLVDERDLAPHLSELELGVRQDDPLGLRVRAALPVDREGQVPELLLRVL